MAKTNRVTNLIYVFNDLPKLSGKESRDRLERVRLKNRIKEASLASFCTTSDYL